MTPTLEQPTIARPFVGDIPRQPIAEPADVPANNIKPFLPVSAPFATPGNIPGLIPAAGTTGGGAALFGLSLIPAIVVGGVIAGTATGTSPREFPPGYEPGAPGAPRPDARFPPPGSLKLPKPPTPKKNGTPGQGYRLFVNYSYNSPYPRDNFSRNLTFDVTGPYTDVYKKDVGFGQSAYAFDWDLNNPAGPKTQGINSFSNSLADQYSARYTDIQPLNGAASPTAPPRPAEPAPAPNPSPYPGNPKPVPANVPKPFTRPSPKTPDPTPPPDSPPVEPKPANVPKPFRRPGEKPNQTPERKIPVPGNPFDNPPLPKTPVREPDIKPGTPSKKPEPKAPPFETPDPFKTPVPQRMPDRSPDPIPSPQGDPETAPRIDPAPFPKTEPLPNPRPNSDPYKEESPNPDPFIPFFPIPIPGPKKDPQTDPAPKKDPAPSPNPNPRPQSDPQLPPQTDPAPKKDPFPSPNPNPPYIPPVPPRPPECPPCPPQIKPPDIVNKCPDPCKDVPQVSITYRKFAGCRTLLGVPNYFDIRQVTVSQPDAAAITLALNNQADLLALQCNVSDAIAAVPDWWQVRLGADRPQLLIQYAQQFPDGTWDKPKYIVSVPYWNKSREATVIDDFPSYQKGQYQGCLILSDNSKLIINAKNAGIASSVVDAISLGIDPLKLIGSEYTTSERRGKRLAEIVIYPRIAKFFATGQKNLNPTWSKRFY